MLRIVGKKGGDAKISEEDSAVVVDEKISSFDVSMYAAICVKVTLCENYV